MTVVKDEKAKPAVVDDHVAKDAAAKKAADATAAKNVVVNVANNNANANGGGNGNVPPTAHPSFDPHHPQDYHTQGDYRHETAATAAAEKV